MQSFAFINKKSGAKLVLKGLYHVQSGIASPEMERKGMKFFISCSVNMHKYKGLFMCILPLYAKNCSPSAKRCRAGKID